MSSNKRKLLAAGIVFIIAISGSALYVDIESRTVVPILMYHSIKPVEDNTSPSVLPDVFEMQMGFLAKNHYNVIDLDEVIRYMTKQANIPPRTVAITADDGLYNFYEYAFPVLKKYHLKATIFVTTDRIGTNGYLGWNELREMSDSGLVTIGSHTKSHPWLPSVSVDDKKINEELVLSKEILEKGIGKKVDYLCYPSGAFNDAVKEIARKAGYKGAFTTNPAKKSAINDIYAIRRIKMSSSSKTPLVLWGKISRYYAWFKEKR